MSPVYNPLAWHTCLGHDVATCDQGINCYSYALNQPDYFWSVPGHGRIKAPNWQFHEAFNTFFKSYSIRQVRQALQEGAERDGLIPTDEPTSQQGYYLTALVFAPDNSTDFHWYRQDAGGLWSHKNGWQSVTNTDDDGVLIIDPRRAARRDYPHFAGFFLVPNAGVRIIQAFPAAQ